MAVIESSLLDHRERLLAYIRGKIADPTVAEDILQDSLLKALRAAPALQDEEKLLPWFYRIINNTIIDLYRHRHVRSKHIGEYEEGSIPHVDEADVATLCGCFRELLPALKPEYAELIEHLDLSEGDPEQVADRLGITRNNLKVRRHRARQALRQRLEESCRMCATHGCLDCTCS